MNIEEALTGAIQWLHNIREKAEEINALGLILLDTQPENINLAGLIKTLNDPTRLTESEKELCRQGKIIPTAVKALRDRLKASGKEIGLKDAKAIIDVWVEQERAAGRLPPRLPASPVQQVRPPILPNIPNTPAFTDTSPTPANGIDVITEEDIASFAKEKTDERSYPLARRDEATPAHGIEPVYGGES